jgi:hypothetical protein
MKIMPPAIPRIPEMKDVTSAEAARVARTAREGMAAGAKVAIVPPGAVPGKSAQGEALERAGTEA